MFEFFGGVPALVVPDCVPRNIMRLSKWIEERLSFVDHF
jgi:hypothetical protein